MLMIVLACVSVSLFFILLIYNKKISKRLNPHIECRLKETVDFLNHLFQFFIFSQNQNKQCSLYWGDKRTEENDFNKIDFLFSRA